MVNVRHGILEVRESLIRDLSDDTNPWTFVFRILERATGIPRIKFFWVFSVFTAVWLVLGYAGGLISNCIGILYPSYASIQAIESKNINNDIKWLVYWIVFSIYSFAEGFAGFFVAYLPLYWLAKCLFFVWLMLPTSFNGSFYIYHTIIVPYFTHYRAKVDDAFQKAQETAAEYLVNEGRARPKYEAGKEYDEFYIDTGGSSADDYDIGVQIKAYSDSVAHAAGPAFVNVFSQMPNTFAPGNANTTPVRIEALHTTPKAYAPPVQTLRYSSGPIRTENIPKRREIPQESYKRVPNINAPNSKDIYNSSNAANAQTFGGREIYKSPPNAANVQAAIKGVKKIYNRVSNAANAQSFSVSTTENDVEFTNSGVQTTPRRYNKKKEYMITN